MLLSLQTALSYGIIFMLMAPSLMTEAASVIGPKSCVHMLLMETTACAERITQNFVMFSSYTLAPIAFRR
jgi:hypothetical protein